MDTLNNKCESCGSPIANASTSEGQVKTCFNCRMASLTKKLEVQKKPEPVKPPEPIKVPPSANNFQMPPSPQTTASQATIAPKDLPERMKANKSMVGTNCTICQKSFELGDNLFNCQTCRTSSMHLECYEKSNSCGNNICKKYVGSKTALVGLKKDNENNIQSENSDLLDEMTNCPHCSEKIKKKAVKCPFCREILSSHIHTMKITYYVPRHEPIEKFIFLSIVSLGVYVCMWFYRQFKRQKEKNNLDTSPFWRAVFSIFWSFGLFAELKKEALGKKFVADFNPALLGTIYLLLSLTSNLPDPYWLIWFIYLVPLIPIVNICNKVYADERNPPSKDSSYTGWEWFFAIFGSIMMLLIIAGLFIPFEE